MKKERLENFIQKYFLSGNINSVTWISTGTQVSVFGYSELKDCFSHVVINEPFETGEYHIFDTKQLKSLLNILGEEFDVQIKKRSDGTPSAFQFISGPEVVFALADKVAMPKKMAPINVPPEWPVVGNILSEPFISTFGKAKAAIGTEEFTLKSDGTTLDIILGYSATANTTRVTIPIPTTHNVPLNPTNFNADYLKDIMMANKDATEGTIKIIAVGKKMLIVLSFQTDEFTTIQYYLNNKL